MRLETDAKGDKKKSELYFGKWVKKILTENSSEKPYRIEKITPGGIVDAALSVTHDLSLGWKKIPFGVAREMNFRTYFIRLGKN